MKGSITRLKLWIMSRVTFREVICLGALNLFILCVVDLYPSELKNWNLGSAKASGFDFSKPAQYYNIGLVSKVESRELSLEAKSNSSTHLGIQADLVSDLLLVEQIDQRLNRSMPIYSNYLLQAGYINMPSARSFDAGHVAIGFAKVPPYTLWSARAQPFDFLEVTGSYRLYDGIPDPVLSEYGFGDYSDKGVNVKWILYRPEESSYCLPSLAIGVDDFLGTRSFYSQYLVGTYYWPQQNIEFSLGWGRKRYKGIFGAMLWTPSPSCALLLEYDASDYKNPKFEPHPKGRHVRSSWNIGLKYRLWNAMDFSLSSIRGEAFAFSLTLQTSLGQTKGFLPKYQDPICILEPACLEFSDFASLCLRQGCVLREASVHQSLLILRIDNTRWSQEDALRRRLNELLCRLLPVEFSKIIVEIESEGLVVGEYHFLTSYLESYKKGRIGEYELFVVSPLKEYSVKNCTSFFCSKKPICNMLIQPKLHNNFGSTRGKYKCAIGVQVGVEGFICNKTYFQFLLGTLLYSDLDRFTGIDRLNPSLLNNVHSDCVRYYQKRGMTLDVAYLQRAWNLANGWYLRSAVGCFERAYGGLSIEVLYSPMNSRWKVGFEASRLYRRTLRGWGFVNKIRKLEGFRSYFRQFHGSQYFFDLYYDLFEFQVDVKVSAGKFLADDWGARTEWTRYFSNGVRMGIWYTYTDGKDRLNGSRYHDKGIFLSMPLDFFYCKSSKERWEYRLAGWLRDVGYRASTGYSLVDMNLFP